MKKILIFVMALILAFGFVSCSTEENEKVEETSSEYTEDDMGVEKIGDLEIDWTKTY